MQPTLFIVGTGPGDPDLLTIKAFNTLKNCPVIVAPKGSPSGNSTALSIVQQALDVSAKEIHETYFPMKKIELDKEAHPEITAAWTAAANKVLNLLDSGKNVAFPTLGDPAIYSTGYYLYDTIMSLRPEMHVKFISGISAMSSCSASTSTPVCLGDDMLAVVPATFCEEKIKKALAEFDAIVLMKVHRVMDRICRILEETGLTKNAIYVEKAGMHDQRIITDLSKIPENPHYFSTIIIRKRGTAPTLPLH
ncbi:precorrin-2 C(20)-methyltransferase [Desulfosediminicola flagellatus]|uniref:precorrin-2 C(20)-methyltransferase n=1 Tax=Desulfosediminicola flagellatus TaxID=2569541 RepID=UPI0010AB915E|nr:precorrin-2 C(20)-methyltransferase [Desulfosediminicola flagellatus]